MKTLDDVFEFHDEKNGISYCCKFTMRDSRGGNEAKLMIKDINDENVFFIVPFIKGSLIPEPIAYEARQRGLNINGNKFFYTYA